MIYHMTSGDPVASRRRRWPQRASRMFQEKRDTSDGTRVKNRTALTMTATQPACRISSPLGPTQIRQLVSRHLGESARRAGRLISDSRSRT